MIYVFDVLMVALVALCVWLGWERGFVRTVSGLLALIAAVLVAAVFSGPIAKAIYSDTVEPKVMDTLSAHVEGQILPDARELDEALDKMPELVSSMLENSGLGSGTAVLEKIDFVRADETAAACITRKVITPVVLPLIKTLCSVVLFSLAYVLALLAARALNVMTKLPLIKQANRFLGLFAGLVTGVLWMLFAIRLLYAVASFGVFPWLTPTRLDDTLLISFVGTVFPSIG